jgi:hypothetical protein
MLAIHYQVLYYMRVKLERGEAMRNTSHLDVDRGGPGTTAKELARIAARGDYNYECPKRGCGQKHRGKYGIKCPVHKRKMMQRV